jgi:ABC-type lipoprotein release transport system permease subunit
VDIGVDTFAIALGLSMLFALFTVSYQSVRAALTDPARSLRYE